VLMGENMKSQIQDMIRNVVENSVNSVLNGVPKNEWDLHELNQVLLPIVPLAKLSAERVADVSDVNALIEKLQDEALKLYDAKEAEFPEAEQFREVERVILLRVIDRKWMEEIDDMDQLRQNIGLQAYAQRNPVDEYKMASYDMMDAMNDAIQTETVTIMYRIRIEKKVEREEVAKVTGTNKDETASSGPKTRKAPKVYPNDPCPCGSGKKYKNCCGAK
ncbi:MAG: SEC-C domain-containing protein, partial [Lachnospiraceae bacterium]|nr:SEC-C domain-containing protein [Lachnospiraceae bacterium]